MAKKKQYETVKCADGFSMSVQANRRAYCSPRNDLGPYDCVEVGYPSSYDIYLRDYAEDPSRPTQTVYGYVPADIITMCIEAHGGLVGGELPPMLKTEIKDEKE